MDPSLSKLADQVSLKLSRHDGNRFGDAAVNVQKYFGLAGFYRLHGFMCAVFDEGPGLPQFRIGFSLRVLYSFADVLP
jgi:hypothetical protein